ncbi:MAG: PAS domain-containing protein, partial [Alphaproteobacteria bacterium]
MFHLVEDRREPPELISNDRLRRLLEYWRGKRGRRAMPSRTDIDPLELEEHLGRLHLLDVIGPNLFRFRLYGSTVTNPGV